MKDRYRLFLRRKSVYYAFDNTTKTFQSLKTKDKAEAKRLLMALNEAGQQPAMNLGLARVYLKHSDPMVSQRTWQHVLDEIIKLKSGADPIPLADRRQGQGVRPHPRTACSSRRRPSTSSQCSRRGTVSTNVLPAQDAQLRPRHELASRPVIPRRQWPAIHFKRNAPSPSRSTRGFSPPKQNPEWRAFYQLCWHLGGSQRRHRRAQRRGR